MSAHSTIPLCCLRWLAPMLAGLFLTVAAPAVTAAAVGLAQLPQRWLEDDGRTLAIDSLAGRRVVLTMAYARCHVVCPQAVRQLQQMQSLLDSRGERVDFVIIGYDPDNDRPSDWRVYRADRHLNRSNWHFLSGSRTDTERLARQLGFDFWRYDEHVMHDARAVVFDVRGELQLALGPETKSWASAL